MSYDRILFGGLAGLTLIFHAACGHAQGAAPPAQASETLKERLSDKASDEQRVDNCKVPPDRRGPTLRPDECKPDAASATLTPPPH